ncbi:hypothetical protein BB560_000130 [Smittium megazygosporum]|uniref:C2H2-type domain-containing protein n=1 Tax=Smittium megazygosporum TaxID=133381 RepID=A0A2T9ZL78_9FUNG|nr:hypothetical protein BB560_000130 [Smittium megazygosporum]
MAQSDEKISKGSSPENPRSNLKKVSDRSACISLIDFLQNGPKYLKEDEEKLKKSKASVDGSQSSDTIWFIKKYKLPNDDVISCVKWEGDFYITSTDIIRALVYRFEFINRPVVHMKKFEEGVFSDLRSLKPGQGARLEFPRSEFLHLLYRNHCVRTQKKQKVFYWYLVPHDQLFREALERDLKREAMGIEPTTKLGAHANKSTIVNIGGIDLPLTIPRDISSDQSNTSDSANNNSKAENESDLVIPLDYYENGITSKSISDQSPGSNSSAVNHIDDFNSKFSFLTDTKIKIKSEQDNIDSIVKESPNSTSEFNLPIDNVLKNSQHSIFNTSSISSLSNDISNLPNLTADKLEQLFNQSKGQNSMDFLNNNKKYLNSSPLHEFFNSLHDISSDFLIPVSPKSNDIFNLFNEIDSKNASSIADTNMITETNNHTGSSPDPNMKFNNLEKSTINSLLQPSHNGEADRIQLNNNNQISNVNKFGTENLFNLQIPKLDTNFGMSNFSGKLSENLFHPYKQNKVSPRSSSNEFNLSSPLNVFKTSLSNNLLDPKSLEKARNGAEQNTTITGKRKGEINPLSSKPDLLSIINRINTSKSPQDPKQSTEAGGSHDRRYICVYNGCDKQFKRHEHLKRHIRTHTGEKPFKCPLQGCEKEFARMDNLHQHVRTHINRRTLSSMGNQRESNNDLPFSGGVYGNVLFGSQTSNLGLLSNSQISNDTQLSTTTLNEEFKTPTLKSSKLKPEFGVEITRVKTTGRIQKSDMSRRKSIRSSLSGKSLKGSKISRTNSIKSGKNFGISSNISNLARSVTDNSLAESLGTNVSINPNILNVPESINLDLHPIRRWSTMPISADPQVPHVDTLGIGNTENPMENIGSAVDQSEFIFPELFRNKYMDSVSTSETQLGLFKNETSSNKAVMALSIDKIDNNKLSHDLGPLSAIDLNTANNFFNSFNESILSGFQNSLPNPNMIDWSLADISIPNDIISSEKDRHALSESLRLPNNIHDEIFKSFGLTQNPEDMSNLDKPKLFENYLVKDPGVSASNTSQFSKMGLEIFNQKLNFLNTKAQKNESNTSPSVSNTEAFESSLKNISEEVGNIHVSESVGAHSEVLDSKVNQTTDSNDKSNLSLSINSQKKHTFDPFLNFENHSDLNSFDHDFFPSASFPSNAVFPTENEISNLGSEIPFSFSKNLDQFFVKLDGEGRGVHRKANNLESFEETLKNTSSLSKLKVNHLGDNFTTIGANRIDQENKNSQNKSNETALMQDNSFEYNSESTKETSMDIDETKLNSGQESNPKKLSKYLHSIDEDSLFEMDIEPSNNIETRALVSNKE